MEMKKRVVFICVHNSARSQMAEAWLNTICGEYFEAQSAGLEPGSLHPLAVKVMAEAGIDISKKKIQQAGRPACASTQMDIGNPGGPHLG